MDADHFKSFNDRFVHAIGDFVLREISTRLQSLIRQDDVLARFGGEEFAIVLMESNAEDVAWIAEKKLPKPHSVHQLVKSILRLAWGWSLRMQKTWVPQVNFCTMLTNASTRLSMAAATAPFFDIAWPTNRALSNQRLSQSKRRDT
jgi:diguanylate cyclase (GGDEF)-like protein